MKRPDELRKELEDLSPRLLKLKEQGEGFNIPANYFQRLQKEVLEKVQATENVPTSTPVPPGPSWLDQLKEQMQFLLQPRWALSLASVALLITLGITWLYQQNQVTTGRVGTELAKLDQQTLDAYIQDNLHEFDTETLMEFASNQDHPLQLNFDELQPEEIDQYFDELIQDLDDETIKEFL
ncbi:MAG TPA: hypothetical protein PLC89_16785 [Haliscomenobacter sp.]|uniref:hypothetical protein n=1 Tax=Haliscomenobacter sp. TaxID=2717303 RepID=UPI002BD88195|nr:hypothetical protein [Haliscomenobacter sp.]HOY18963.1 hypothetical protein [Haliscomenobacter sp.]